jgi:predicted transcriptional regulator
MTRNRRHLPDLGPVEYKLLRILWKRQPATARQVLDEYNAGSPRRLKYTTVMTLLTRMAEKGVLNVDRERQPFTFSPCVSREQMLGQRIREFVETFFDGQPLDLALRLVEEADLDDSSLRRLEERLEQHRRERERGPRR